MTTVLFFAIIYFLSLTIHLVWLYFENKRHIYTVGDIIDDIEFYMWFPVLNTIFLVAFVVMYSVMELFRLLRFDKAWAWFRNIKIR